MRKISNYGAPRMMKVVYPVGLCVGLFIYVAYIKWHQPSTPQALSSITGAAHTSSGSAARAHEVFYGIMFDAGSTGTRVHVFQFAQPPGETPTLTHETFKALKPGLSAYADDVEKSAQGIQELLDIAKQDIPFDFWKATPLVLKATAGLRLLPGEKAQKLLQKVKEVFKASPFLVGDDCVSIMNGTDEGVSAWITVNFLTGSLRGPGRSSVGMLDLGGGSTQITFLPRAQLPGAGTDVGAAGDPGWHGGETRQGREGVGQPLSASRVQRPVGTRRNNVQDLRTEGRAPPRAVCQQGIRSPPKQGTQGRRGRARGLLRLLLLLRPGGQCGSHSTTRTNGSVCLGPAPASGWTRPCLHLVPQIQRREAASQSRTSRSRLSTVSECAGRWEPNCTSAPSSAWTSPTSACCSESSAFLGTKY
ncbi:ectonucleoside triphosphate diphosphohydrolase 6 isoform X9 [Heterocephalus glaber]|uniref:nucleoside diphosphate phosphatase n=1 Tax=Heterocephalus glaber TaxID=10181 RepID=A0AAX6SGX6_HETGA|nr:ectonucleoside triphosphate diphosphohydrolase 6 isoform X9 [Heterocephalus glaber]